MEVPTFWGSIVQFNKPCKVEPYLLCNCFYILHIKLIVSHNTFALKPVIQYFGVYPAWASINFVDFSSTVFIGRLYCHGNSFLLWGILWLGSSFWEFLEGNFWSTDFLGFVENAGDFGGFGFLSLIWSSWLFAIYPPRAISNTLCSVSFNSRKIGANVKKFDCALFL